MKRIVELPIEGRTCRPGEDPYRQFERGMGLLMNALMKDVALSLPPITHENNEKAE